MVFGVIGLSPCLNDFAYLRRSSWIVASVCMITWTFSVRIYLCDTACNGVLLRIVSA